VARLYPLVFLPEVEVIHYGGVSTRQHIGYASVARAVGYAQYLRKSGYTGAALWAYKAAVTLDAPVLLTAKGLEYLGRRLRGDAAGAARSRRAWEGARRFLTSGLLPFWKA
jgi:hypothetical protein